MTTRALLLAPLLLLLAACGGGGSGSITGQLSDTDGRACVQTESDNGICYDAQDGQLTGFTVGSCVTIDYDRADDGQLGRVRAIKAAPSPCVG